MDKLLLTYRYKGNGADLYQKHDSSYLLIPSDDEGDEILAKGISFSKLERWFDYLREGHGDDWVKFEVGNIHPSISDFIQPLLRRHPYFDLAIDFEEWDDEKIRKRIKQRDHVVRWLQAIPGSDFVYELSEEEKNWMTHQ